jgi:hypothetical protein
LAPHRAATPAEQKKAAIRIGQYFEASRRARAKAPIPVGFFGLAVRESLVGAASVMPLFSLSWSAWKVGGGHRRGKSGCESRSKRRNLQSWNGPVPSGDGYRQAAAASGGQPHCCHLQNRGPMRDPRTLTKGRRPPNLQRRRNRRGFSQDRQAGQACLLITARVAAPDAVPPPEACWRGAWPP